jgi:hypothetical protein
MRSFPGDASRLRVMRFPMVVARLVLLSSALVGCGALQSAQTGVGSATSAVGQGKGAVDQAKDAVSGKKGDQAGGGGAAGGDEGEGDDDRLHAKECTINSPLDDKVDFKKGDKSDWRKVMLLGKAGIATFELHWDDEVADLDVDVYNTFGDAIGRSPPKMEGSTIKRVLVEVEKPGLYYVRVSAPSVRDSSIYTLQVRWSGPAAPIAQTARHAASAPATPPAPTGPVTLASDPSKVLGSIITAYREGAGWVLYLDKGSADKIRPGISGQLLDGPDGDKLLSGGQFTISQVIDANKSIAKCNMSKPPGKNKRIVINLK